MGIKKAKNKKKNELKLIFFIILVSAVLFIVSTYAWFSTQRNVSITNLSGEVQVAEGLEISLDAKTWSNSIVLKDRRENAVNPEGSLSIIDDSYDADPNTEGHQSPNLYPSEMLPVSTLGLISNISDPNNGALKGLKMLRGKLTNSKELSNFIIADETKLTPDTNTDLPEYYGYFAFDIFLKNSSKSTEQEDVLQLNYDSSLEILEAEKSVTGLQNTARVAFAKYGGNVGAAGYEGVVDSFVSDQLTILKGTGAYDSALGGNNVYLTDVAIWEPNANDHVQYIVDQQKNTPITWGAADANKYNEHTYDVDAEGNEKKGFGLTTAIPTYALKDSVITEEGETPVKINDIYRWDSSEEGKHLAKQVTLKTSKTSETDYTVQEGVQNLISTSDTGDGTTTFKLAPNSIIRLRVYLWLEGQDVDCINYASHGGGVKVNIGLVKSSPLGQPTEVPAG